MKFEWDVDKNRVNIEKHGIPFETAKSIFDGFTVDHEDDRFAYGEVRIISLGMIEKSVVLVVVHTDRKGHRRIISARQANRKEKEFLSKKYKKPLTPEELAARPYSEIDYSDAPELDAEFWANAKVTAPRTKPNVSLRLPEEVIDYFKAQNPKGYTGRMAAVLSAYVNAHEPK